VKTVKLRGAISQGIVTSPQDVLPDGNFVEGQDITELLGVTKYEPPVVAGAGGNLIALPPLVSIYDIEGAERFTAQVEKYLLDVPVMVTEKLEGSHFAASISADGIAVCQRRFRIDPIDSVEHDWHKAARKSGLLEKLPALKAEIEQRFDHPVQVVTVRGEMIGPSIQGNHYRLPTQVLRIFEIEADGIPLEVQPYLDLVAQFQLDTVPLLVFGVTLREWLAGQTLSQASNGLSILNPDVVREGVVIRPLLEMRDEDLGRVIIKQRSPVYLAGSDY
jgi:RNA ligase (TIGR02306 family)